MLLQNDEAMVEIYIENKKEYLEENYPFADVPELDEKKLCIHCEEEIVVGDYKVFKDKKGEEWIYCPNAPDCDGTPIDWFRIE